MEKIGIVTYFKIYNYGSFLQSYSMVNFLKENNFEPELLDITYNKCLKLYFKSKVLFKLLLHPGSFQQVKQLRVMGKRSVNKLNDEIISKFNSSFVSDLPIRQVDYFQLLDDAKSDAYSFFIVGSDQIWSPLGIDLKPHKFLDFAPKYKRIAYAPSFGVSYIPIYNKKAIKRKLKNIKTISVREESGKDLIQKLIGVQAPVVLDPTLMMSKKFWMTATLALKRRPYMLCYFLHRPDNVYCELAEKIAKLKSLEIIYLPYNHSFKEGYENGFVSAGPFEFASLIRNAEFVLTDSFHGTAFSLIFEIPFFAVPRYKDKQFEQSTRITDILDKLGLSHRFISNVPSVVSTQIDVDFSYATDVLNSLRIESRQFLLNALNKESFYE